jgi:hypothetical protein
MNKQAGISRLHQNNGWERSHLFSLMEKTLDQPLISSGLSFFRIKHRVIEKIKGRSIAKIRRNAFIREILLSTIHQA